MTDRKMYIDKFAGKLKEYDSEIEKLENKARDLLGEAKSKINEGISGLQLKRRNTENKLNELKKSSTEAWMEIKNGVEEMEEDLQKSIVRAKQKFLT